MASMTPFEVTSVLLFITRPAQDEHHGGDVELAKYRRLLEGWRVLAEGGPFAIQVAGRPEESRGIGLQDFHGLSVTQTG